jgi:hydroxymethylpyrimidine/phosphomethylpyrimidine kinase
MDAARKAEPALPKGRVLIIAGSDSGGGAGIQADLKTVTMLGGYAMTAITAITVQNTLGVHGVVAVPIPAIRGQIEVCLSDIGADVIKTGMLGTKAVVEAVAEALALKAPGIPRVIDPVMVAKGGSRLLDRDAVDAVKSLLVPGAGLLTPNAPEAEVLTGRAVETLDGQRRAADRLLEAGAEAVLVKGGHIGGDRIIDLLMTREGEHRFESPRIDTRATHGTGCTLASAIAAHLAQGAALPDAVERARAYLHEAIKRAQGFGAGHGPVDHGWPLRARAT